jgi:exonuclease SbcD
MRLLHTSDWHLGRSLHRADLRAAQSAFLDHLVDTVRAEKVDAVLVAGDVYDRAVPPVDAVELCEDTLLRLNAIGARIVLISGNHDSARRLGFGSGLLDQAGVHLRTRPSALARPVMLEDAHGAVAVYGVPYLEPDAVRGELPPAGEAAAGSAEAAAGAAAGSAEAAGEAAAEGAEPGEVPRGHTGVLGHALRCIRADAEARGVRRRVVMAHGWVAGGAASESERDITVGGVGQVPAELFDGFGYVALGHLHGQQTLASHLRYSGSPLPYSFSEASHRKGSWLVELDGDGTARVERVPAPAYQRLSVLRGRLADLLRSPAYAKYEDDFVSVTLTDPTRPEGVLGPMDALRTRFPYVLVLAFEPEGVLPDRCGYRARIAGRDDLAIAAEFVQHVRNAPAAEAEKKLLAEAFEAVRTDTEEDG